MMGLGQGTRTGGDGESGTRAEECTQNMRVSLRDKEACGYVLSPSGFPTVIILWDVLGGSRRGGGSRPLVQVGLFLRAYRFSG